MGEEMEETSTIRVDNIGHGVAMASTFSGIHFVSVLFFKW